MARTRILTDEQRLQRIQASKRAWAERNAEYLRQAATLRRLKPTYAEEKRREYVLARKRKMEAGWIPNPVGRPRITSQIERLERQRLSNHKAMSKWRAKKKTWRPKNPTLLDSHSAAFVHPQIIFCTYLIKHIFILSLLPS